MIKRILNLILIMVILLQPLSSMTIVGDAATTQKNVKVTKSSQTEYVFKITKQPSSVVVANGAIASVKVAAVGKGLKYKWYFKEANSKKFIASSSYKGNTYSVTMSDSRNGRKIYCIITDKYGKKLKTNAVTLKNAEILKVSNKAKTIEKLSGKVVVLSAKTNLKGKLKYQWYFAEKGSKTFKKASSKTKYYQITMSAERSGRRVYCIAKNEKGEQVKTQVATLSTVKKLKIVSQPKEVMAPEGKEVNISFKVSGGKGLEYQWYIKNKDEDKFGKSSLKDAVYSTLSSNSSNRRKVYCVVTDKFGQKVKTDTVTIKMSAVVKVGEKTKTINVLSGKNAIVTVKTNLKGNLKYQWYYANSGSNVFKKTDKKTATYKTVMNSERDGRKIYCVITDGKGRKYTSQTAILNNIKRLKITQEPKNVVASKGNTATVSFRVVGEKNLTYTWYIKNKNDRNFGKSTVTKNYYEAVASKSLDGRKVYCVITDKYGQKVTTKTVTMRMAEVLKVSKATKEVMVHDSETAILSASVSGKGKLKYQWYCANPKSNKFYKSSVKSSTYKVVVNESRDGMKVYCMVTDDTGKKFKTQTAILNNIKELKITNQPKDVTIPNGDKVTVSFKVSGEKQLKYQWYIKEKGSKNFKKTSCTSLEYSVKMTDAVNGRKMYCVITDNYGQKVKTDVISFKKIKRLTVTKQPKGDLVMNGEIITLNTSATGEGKLSYRWMYADAGEKNFAKTSITSTTYEVKMDSNRNGRRMYCLISDAYGQEVTTNIVTLKSYKKLVITEQPKNITKMSGKNATAKFGISGEEDLNYTWYIKNVEDDKFYKSSDTDSEYSIKITNENSGRQAYCVVTDNHGQKVTTNTITFKKNPNALHILIIGNSHSLDTFWFLRSAYMDQNPNSDICVAILYSSSGSIAGHSRVIKNNEATNRYYLNNNGKWNCTYDVSHKEVLEDQEWDIILMQPGKADITTRTVNMVSRYEVVDYVNQHVKNPHKFVWHVTWPCPNDETFFSPDYIRQPPAGYKDRLERLYDFNPINQYKEKVEKTQNVVLKENFYSNYVYTGAAVMHALYEQNVSQLELYRDYTHLSDYGRLLASYAFYAQLFEKPIQEVGINVISQNSRFYLFEHLGDIKLTQRQKNIIVKAANYALNDKLYIPEDK